MAQTLTSAPLENAPFLAARPVRTRPVSFVAWGSIAGRPAELAEAMGGEARCFFPIGSRRRPPVLIRYALCAVATAAHLVRHRPKLVIVTNPPVPGALITYLLARIVGAKVGLDSHPGGFGAQGDRVAARLQRFHRFLVRRSEFVLVTNQSWSDMVTSWGGAPIVVHEAPGGWDMPPPQTNRRLQVLMVNTFSSDEPVEEFLSAAARLPECDFLLTGERSRCPSQLLQACPSNVRLTGFLDPAGYRAAMEGSDAVITLTTEATSVMRAAYEAVYARRPVIVSDWPLSRELFPYALHARNQADDIVGSLRALSTGYRSALDRVEQARGEQLDRWSRQQAVLAKAIDDALPKSSEQVEVMGVRVDNVTDSEAVVRMFSSLELGQGGRAASLNVDILRRAVIDPEFRRLLDAADLVLADGMPIVWASRLRGAPLAERVAPSEMIFPLCAESAARGIGVLLLGGSPGTAERAAEVLTNRFADLTVAHLCPPLGFEHSDTEMAKIVQMLDQTEPGVVFCGFGAPKQERLMAKLAERYTETWFIACGGTFSMVTGDLPKAPAWMQGRSLEWLHRLRLEPRRLFTRYIVHDLPFALRLFASSLRARFLDLEVGR